MATKNGMILALGITLLIILCVSQSTYSRPSLSNLSNLEQALAKNTFTDNHSWPNGSMENRYKMYPRKTASIDSSSLHYGNLFQRGSYAANEHDRQDDLRVPITLLGYKNAIKPVPTELLADTYRGVNSCYLGTDSNKSSVGGVRIPGVMYV